MASIATFAAFLSCSERRQGFGFALVTFHEIVWYFDLNVRRCINIFIYVILWYILWLHTYMNKHTHIYIHLHNIHIFIYIHIYIYIYIIYIYTYTYIIYLVYIYIFTYIHIYIHIHNNICIIHMCNAQKSLSCKVSKMTHEMDSLCVFFWVSAFLGYLASAKSWKWWLNEPTHQKFYKGQSFSIYPLLIVFLVISQLCCLYRWFRWFMSSKTCGFC